MVPEIRKFELYKRFVADRVAPTDFPQWCEARAAELKVTTRAVKGWIVKYDEVTATEVHEQAQSQAKRRAVALGLTEEKALSTVRDALEATERRQLHDRNGDPTFVFETPDWQARLSAANTALKIHDSFPASKVEVTIDPNDPRNWTDEQLLAGAAAEGVDISHLLGARGAGAAGDERRAILAPELHQDEGRAASGGPVPPVSGQALLPAAPEPVSPPAGDVS